MTINEYHQLLKFLYFEGYADSYEEAEYIMEEMNDEDFGALCEEVFPQYTQEDVDILDYLIYEGFADDNESALVILENMSEEWRDSIVEARRFVPKDEAQARLDRLPPEERAKRVLRNSGANQGGWGTKLKSSLEKQRQRRKVKLNPFTQSELESHARKGGWRNPTELSAIAMDRERDARKKQKEAARRLTKKTGVLHVGDHMQPIALGDKNLPGDVASNIQVTSEPKNLKKGSKLPKKGQRGYGATREDARRRRLAKAQAFADRLDDLIDGVRNNP